MNLNGDSRPSSEGVPLSSRRKEDANLALALPPMKMDCILIHPSLRQRFVFKIALMYLHCRTPSRPWLFTRRTHVTQALASILLRNFTFATTFPSTSCLIIKQPKQILRTSTDTETLHTTSPTVTSHSNHLPHLLHIHPLNSNTTIIGMEEFLSTGVTILPLNYFTSFATPDPECSLCSEAAPPAQPLPAPLDFSRPFTPDAPLSTLPTYITQLGAPSVPAKSEATNLAAPPRSPRAGRIVRINQCGHVFHLTCLHKLLSERSAHYPATCPLDLRQLYPAVLAFDVLEGRVIQDITARYEDGGTYIARPVNERGVHALWELKNGRMPVGLQRSIRDGVAGIGGTTTGEGDGNSGRGRVIVITVTDGEGYIFELRLDKEVEFLVDALLMMGKPFREDWARAVGRVFSRANEKGHRQP
ncbi:hypothetical protein P154DRAFT_574422 [Amniculicola lignicola CBS 123094]|uniref:Uncharacterized protein n=1 Tax=Amniculicola lignicola CBS 123094 TaxID=1392246 RepID=A0A6A5WM77_9PLEO|nr:hypothetical protein P154DRAFT_574422 [Amniculicola lignicola CBS 123094]